jgi:hypothetical protein
MGVKIQQDKQHKENECFPELWMTNETFDVHTIRLHNFLVIT